MSEKKEQTGYPSIDKPWLKYYSAERIHEPLKKCTIYQYIFDENRNHLQDTAILYFGKKIDYEALFHNVECCTKALLLNGIKRGDCINILTAAIPEAVYLALACSRIGIIANFINPVFDKIQMTDRINDTSSDWLFVMDALVPRVQTALNGICSRHVVLIPIKESLNEQTHDTTLQETLEEQFDGVVFLSWSSFLLTSTAYKGPIIDKYIEDTPALMVYSSGSTGASKGILHTNDSVNATMQDSMSSGVQFQRGLVYLQMIPIWFSTGIVQSILLPLSMGVIVAMEPRFDNRVFVEDLLAYRPTLTLVATNMWVAAMQDERMANADLSTLIYPFTGGEKVMSNIERALNDFFKKHGCTATLFNGYGMCELGGKVTDSLSVKREGSVGIPMSRIVIGIFDPSTNEELSYGKHGEIRVASPAHMKEYYKNKAATDQFFWKDNAGTIWGCTGDIGYIDEDGLLFVLGRATDSFINDSKKIVYLFDIENEIIKENCIEECKVVDIATGAGKKIVAHIIFRQTGNADEILRRIQTRLKECLPEYMLPDYYKTRETMPVNTNGKRDIGLLRQDTDNLIDAKNV